MTARNARMIEGLLLFLFCVIWAGCIVYIANE
nr:MAG TPA: hypothetical protein [Caudoviricetes sp.]